MTNLIILPNGTEINSGKSRENAIISCTYTQCVNDGTELSVGSACCNELELKLFVGGGLSIATGDEIRYYKVDDSGARTKIGVFCCEKPTVTGTGTYKFVAYDNVSKLDKDLTDWLAALDGWPYTVAEFAENVCVACGLSLSVHPMVNASYKIRKFSGSGVTGRMLMQWLGQIACRFIRANADGEIEFAWYTDKGAEIATKGELAYFGGGLSYEDYQVVEIQKVQIQASESDNGTVYPDGNEEELNTYKITGNYLLTAETGDELKPVAQAIYEQLQGAAYTPCKVSIRATTAINAGDIVHITDRNGVRIAAYVMSKTNKGEKDTLECTGSYKRDSSTATNNISLKALNGKVLDISKSVDGLRIENADTAGRVAKLELDVDGIALEVSNYEVGGQNLLVGTRDFSGFTCSPEDGYSIMGDGDFSYVEFRNGAPGDGEYKYIASFKEPIPLEYILNKKAVVSFEIMDESPWTADGTDIRLEYAVCSATSNKRLKYRLENVEAEVPSSWTKVVQKLTIDEEFFSSGTGDFTEATRFWLRMYCNNDDCRLRVRKFKLELGTVATDWSDNTAELGKNVSSLKITADGLTESVKNANGDIYELSIRADEQQALIENAQGDATKALEKAGEVHTQYIKGDGVLTTDIDGTGLWSAKYTENGVVKSSVTFDLDRGVFKFNGELASEDGLTRFDVSDNGGMAVRKYDDLSGPNVAIGKIDFYYRNGTYYPYMLLGDGTNQKSMVIRWYNDGVWIGNGLVEQSSDFQANSGASGYFINTQTGENWTYVNGKALSSFEAVFA